MPRAKVLDHVRDLRRRSPRDVVTVLVPEDVVGHWWEQLLPSQSALRQAGDDGPARGSARRPTIDDRS